MPILFDLSKRPTRHSYSAIKKYLECPTAYALSYIQKLADPPSAAMMRGTRLHKLAEDYMGNADMAVPYDIKKIGLKIYQLRQYGAKPEAVWMVTKDWLPTESPAHARLKAIIDVHWLDKDVLRLHDYKSGREYPSHSDQLELYSAVGLCQFPHARRADGSAIYIDSGKEGAERGIIREMLPHILKRWTTYLDTIDSDVEFRPTAGGHCKRCSYGISKGGPCEAEQR